MHTDGHVNGGCKHGATPDPYLVPRAIYIDVGGNSIYQLSRLTIYK
jgi:hypothetical protein